ncbi:MAG: hypothetical protein FXF47_04045 [Candidatus Mcinerneyibacterium aminivorans]|jgi:hypothetical protein|uniref:Outer membrane protein beta-barrel domain-containing protein n=1 Tax=Candidatus Mcinerneyibacterium aminivorans TaxID=2703815 RepID=A0A5D0MCI4_9BACT|nr:MAG: hypothetical protein FXF47_04045 [Candidatus Mcinerneyibacterium aminivorans]
MKKIVIVLILVLGVIFTANASPLGMEIEVRGGGYLTVAPESAKNMFGNGYLIGGSLRKSVFPMVKLGLSVDRIAFSKDALQYVDMSTEMQETINAASDEVDVEYTMLPICGELFLDPPLLPLYAHAGVGMYRSSIKVTLKDTGEVAYDEAETKLGGFIGAGTKLGIPMIPISFRAGAKYHILKLEDKALDESMKAISLEAGVRIEL